MMIATMSRLGRSLYGAVAAAALVFVTTNPLTATPSTTTFTLLNAGSGANLAGVYTSPYNGTVSSSSPTIPVICDDFSDESYVPETWTAYVTSLSSINSGTADTSVLRWQPSTINTLYGTTPGLSQAQAYDAAAILAIDILTTNISTPAGLQTQEDLSYALWGLFDPCGNGTNGTPPTSCLGPTGTPALTGDLGAFGQLETYSSGTSDLSNAESYLSAAIATATSPGISSDLSNYNVTIYSYDTGASGSCSPSCGQPQEFIAVSMAEAPGPAILGVDLLGLAGLVLIARRRGWLAD
jgi:hypothetical protein